MRSRLVRLFALLMVAVMVVSCAQADETPAPAAATATPAVEEPTATPAPEEPTATPAAEEPTATPAAEGEAPPPGQVEFEGAPVLNPDVSGTVEFWHFWASPVRRTAIQRVIAICENKLPNIDVVDTVKPWGDIWTANLAAVAAGSGMPDVIVSDRPTLPKDAADGVYQPVQEWAERDGVGRDQYFEWAWDQTLYQDQSYGIPHETDVSVLFWNKQLFEEAGLDPEDPPETWEEVEQYADALDVVDEDGNLVRVGFFPLWNRGVDIWQYTNDAEMLTMENGEPVVQINNPNMIETVQWIKGWVDRYGGWQNIQDFRAQFAAPPNDIFMSGSAAMLVDIYGYNSILSFYRPTVALQTGETPRMEWGIGLLPHDEDADPGTWSGGFALSIPTGAPNAEAAWEFIKCAAGPWGQASWARDTAAQPTNLQALDDPALSASPYWDVAVDSLEVSTGGVYLSEYPNWGEQLGQRWEEVWRGDLAPEEALNQAQAAVQEEVQ